MSKSMSDILREYLLEERSKNPSVNETSLSKKMNIPPTTFNRILNGYSKPNVITMLKLIQFIPELRKSLPPEVSQLLEVSQQRKESDGYLGVNVETLLYDKNNFICCALASLNKGVTKKEIKDILGTPGEKAFDFLEKKNIISRGSDNRYRVTTKNQKTVVSFPLIKRHVQFLTEQYNLYNIASNSNYIHYLIVNVNKEGLKQIMKVHNNTHKKVQEIMNAKEYEGDISVFSVGCSDLLSNQEEIGSGI